MLVYLKASLTGDEPADVLNYAVENKPFPHQTTLNQFFTESQFESYRELGRHIGSEVFGEAARDAECDDVMTPGRHIGLMRKLFSHLRRRWFQAPAEATDPSIMTSVSEYTRLHTGLEKDPLLAELDQGLYPELNSSRPPRAASP